MTPRLGRIGRVSLSVTEDDTAIAVKSGDVPVLATPRLVALCEQAAVAALAGQLEATSTSVGLAIDLKHLQPTLVGVTVEAEARLEDVSGRKLTFSVRATQDDTEIARGRHVRVVVDREQFLKRAVEAE